MSNAAPVRPGLPAITLLAILVITTAWWALALWPAGVVEPEWLLRTRAVCFGSPPGGLPDVGGWIVLIGEPAGMLAALMLVWGDALRRDLRRLVASPPWRVVVAAVTLAALAGLVKTGQRIVTLSSLGTTEVVSSGAPTPVDLDLSSHRLVDQRGQRVSFSELGTVVLTFAFGHCSTVCPAIVHDVLAARGQRSGSPLPIVVVTLDPWRDTPEHLHKIATAWGLGGTDRVLSGTVEEVNALLDALDVQRRRDTRTGDVEHVSAIMTTDASGHVRWRLDGPWGRLGDLLRTVR